jgi:hypothetical protein
MTLTKPAQRTDRTSPRRDQRSGDLDPAKLGATLCDLALRAYRLIRATDGSGFIPEAALHELIALHVRIVRLHVILVSHQRFGLAEYVSALREKLEECRACRKWAGMT